MMRKKFYYLCMVAVIMFAGLMFTACGNNSEILGTWTLTGMAYTFGGETKTYSCEQIAELEYVDGFDNVNNEQFHKNAMIGLLNMVEVQQISFNKKNVKIGLNEYKYKESNSQIKVEINNEITFSISIEENVLKLHYPLNVDDVYIDLCYSK